MTSFKEALLVRLTAELTDPDRPAPTVAVARRRSHRPLALVAAGVATVALVGVYLMAPRQTGPAYAVTTDNDAVTLKINFVGDPKEANRLLHKAGISAVIVLEKPKCRDHGGGTVPDDSINSRHLAVQFAVASQTHTLRIRRADIPQGQVLVVVPNAQQRRVGAGRVAGQPESAGPGLQYSALPFMTVGMYRLPAPTCAVPWADQHHG